MTNSVGVHEARIHLSRLLDAVAAGEEVLITRRGQPVARLVSLHPGTPRAFGIDRGRLVIPEDFDAPVEDPANALPLAGRRADRALQGGEAVGLMGNEQRVAVYGICEDGDGHVLLARAAPWLSVGGEWFLPGGGLDHGEDPVAGLRREFAEETGLTVGVGELRGVLSDVIEVPDGTSLHTVRIIYAIASFSGVVRHEEGGSTDNARWVAVADAWALPLRPYVRQALTRWRRLQ